MQKQKLIIFSAIMLFGLIAGIYQYAKEFRAEFTNAAGAKPANGHLWGEMECGEGLCISKSNKVGIGGDPSATNSLKVTGNTEVTGNINAAGISTSGIIRATGNITSTEGDICNSKGACLSQLSSFIETQPVVGGSHTRAQCETAKGKLIDISAAYPVCRFDASECPKAANSNGTGDWVRYQNWTTTESKTMPLDYYPCAAYTNGGFEYCPCAQPTPTPFHNWSNVAPETSLYEIGVKNKWPDPGSCTKATATSIITQIGCQ